MGKHSVAETKNKLSDLIKRAQKGEAVIITKHGEPVAKIMPIRSEPKVLTNDLLDWLAERRKSLRRAKDDAGARVSRMRDEDWR